MALANRCLFRNPRARILMVLMRLSMLSSKPLLAFALTNQRFSGRLEYAEEEMFCVNSARMLTGVSIKFLCAMVNSQLVNWFIPNTSLNSGMGVPRWIRSAIESIPIPRSDEVLNRSFIRLIYDIVRRRTLSYRRSVDTASELESHVDAVVYRRYGITDQEIDAVTLQLDTRNAEVCQ